MNGPPGQTGPSRSATASTKTARRLAGLLAAIYLVLLPGLPRLATSAFARPFGADGTVAGQAAAQTAAFVTLGENLVANPGAEDGPSSASGGDVVTDIPGWTRVGGVTVVRYAPKSGHWPTTSEPGPVERGAAFFTGGPQDQVDSLWQIVDLSSLAATIDSGTVRFSLAAYLGGMSNSQDNVVVQTRFLGASGMPLSAATVGPVTADDRGGDTGLLLRTTPGALPVGTRTAVVVMIFIGTTGQNSWGLADSVGLSLSRALMTTLVWPMDESGLHLAIAPDPAIADARVECTLPAPGPARVEVLDVTGRCVARLADGVLPAGRCELRWSPRQSGAEAGVYFVRLTSPSGTVVRRLVALAR